MKKRRLLGILLSLALMMTMMPALAFAEDAPDAKNTETKNVAAEEVSVSGEVQYPLWIGETQVTSENLSGQGWSYDVESNTLTLDGFNYEGTGHKWKPGEYYTDRSSVIFTENDLTIELKGKNSINDTDDKCSIFTIYSDKSLTINGGGVLELPENDGGYGFYSKTDLSINNATIKNKVGSFRVGGECTITGSSIEATNDYTTGLCVYGGDLVINGSTITAAGDENGIYVGEGDAVFNNSEVTATSEDEEGIYVCGIFEINDSVVESKSFSDEEESVYAYNLEMNSGRLEAIATDCEGIVINEHAVINGGSIVASGNYGFYGDRKISFKGGDVTLVGTEHGLHAGQKVILSDKATVMAGENEEGAKDVTSTFAKEHDQKWAHIVVTPDPEPAPIDPTAVGTLHEVPSSVGVYVVTAADAVSLAKAPSKKSYTLPATVTINGKVFNVTGINVKAFKGTKVRTLTVKTKGLTKASVKGSLKGSKVRTVKVKVGKKKENKKFVKKYKKIFTKKNAGKKVSVRR